MPTSLVAAAKAHLTQIAYGVGLVWRAGPVWMVLSSSLILVQGVLPVLLLYALKQVVDGVGMALESSGSSESDPHKVIIWICIAGFATLCLALCRVASRFLSEEQGERVADYTYGLLHAKSVEVDLEFYENSEYHDALHRAQHEAPTRPLRIVGALATVLVSAISVISIGALIFLFDRFVALGLVVAVVPSLAVKLFYSRVMFDFRKRQARKEREANYYNWLMTWEPHAKDIRLLGLGDLFRKRFQKVRAGLRMERRRIAVRRSILEIATDTISTIVLFLCTWLVIARTLSGTLSLGDFVMFFAAFQRAQSALQESLQGMIQLYESCLFLTSLRDFLDLEPVITAPRVTSQRTKRPERGIVFDNVSFKYPNSGHWALHRINVSIGERETIALVGENGSGKTTLVKLLSRLYDPTEGSIRLNGVDLRDMDPVELRRRMSVVVQDFGRYHLSARDNIAFGNVESNLSGLEVQRAAEISGAHEILEELSNGYDTVLGRILDGRTDLSEGQWQRVALARALVRPSEILVLDEPTSSLDPIAEYRLFQRFIDVAQGRTTLLISHRLATVRNAHRILVLGHGSILEVGSHDDLIKGGKAYADMFEKQAASYRL